MTNVPLIADVLAYYGLGTIVVRKGWFPIRCPFHDDETASASVNLDLDGFRCHACGTRGDAIGLVMSQEDLPDRSSAISFIEEELGISHDEIRKRRGRSGGVSSGKRDNGGSRPSVPSRGS